jgi:hypothetical protein
MMKKFLEESIKLWMYLFMWLALIAFTGATVAIVVWSYVVTAKFLGIDP